LARKIKSKLSATKSGEMDARVFNHFLKAKWRRDDEADFSRNVKKDRFKKVSE
jgi:hypothetical protein